MKILMKKSAMAVAILSLILNSTTVGADAQVPDALTTPARPIDTKTRLEEIQKVLGDTKPQLQEVRPDVIQELKKFAESDRTPTNMRIVTKLDRQANEFFDQGRYNDALRAWQRAYGKSIEMKYSEGQGRALSGMCKVYVTQGKWVKARHLGENAVEVLAAVKDNVSLGKARVALAQAYFGLENPVWASRQLDEALKLLMDQADKEPLAAADMLQMAGSLLIQYKKPLEATRFFQQSCKYLEQGKKPEAALLLRTKLVNMMTELGWYVAAGEEAQKGLKLAERVKDPAAMITALSSMGNSQYVLGEYLSAKESYEKAYEIAKGLPAKKQVSKEGRAYLMMGYAFSLAAVGDTERARKMFESLVPYFEKKGKFFEQAQALNAIGVIECSEGSAYKAIPMFSKALDIEGMINPHRPRLHMYILRNLAAAEYRVGKYREAYAHLKSVATDFSKKNLVEGYGLAKTRAYASLAETAIKMQDSATARTFIDATLKLGDRYKDDSSLWRAYTMDAQMLLGQKKVDEAKEKLKHALSHFRSPQAGYFPSPENITFPTNRREFGMRLIAMVASQGMTEQALLVAEQLKEESVINTWVVKNGATLKPEDKDVYLDLMRQRAHLHAAEQSTSPKSLTKEWTAWLQRFGKLAHENRSLARLISPYPTNIPEVIKTVRERKLTVIEYLVGEKSSVAFTVDPAGRISATVLPVDESTLSEQISQVMAGARSGSEKAYQPALKALYGELLPQTVRKYLPITSDDQIVIIPDGVLYNLPFAALVDDNDQYLVEGHLLSLAPSMRSLLDTKSGMPAALSVLVASGETPGERSETNQISRAVHPEPISTLGERDLSSLEEAVKGKSVLHFATALPLADSNPIAVPIPFTGDDKERKATTGSLFGLKLPSDLVVLSGTAVKGDKLEGTAVQIVSRGLAYAGAKNVMMTLWPIEPSQRISELVNFYKNKKQGLNAARSLRQAQLLSMSRNRSPRNWASFQLLGVGM